MITNIIHSGISLLDLCYFFTVGQDEVKAWPVRKQSLAPQAASVIHTDF
jgi:ribosome-binding ATPase YchF (GTP1/OBG family)